MEWHAAVRMLEPFVIRVASPSGSGTGFLVSQPAVAPLCAIATAAHVIAEAQVWELPIKLEHHTSQKSVLLHHADRVIFVDAARDTAAIVFDKKSLPLGSVPPALIAEGRITKVGVELGWLGFPAVSPSDLCFFSGRVSAHVEDGAAYLVDGVAINGVSGGPAFRLGSEEPVVIGVVSAYIANRATGEVLPGLSVVRGVHQFQALAKRFTNLDEAQKKKAQTDKEGRDA